MMVPQEECGGRPEVGPASRAGPDPRRGPARLAGPTLISSEVYSASAGSAMMLRVPGPRFVRGMTASMAGLSIGKFQVLGQLGTGAHSTILHVRRSVDSRSYALKVVPIDGPQDRKFLEQARHEFHVAQQLDHPNLIKIYALETER